MKLRQNCTCSMQRSATRRYAFKLTKYLVILYECWKACAEESNRNLVATEGAQLKREGLMPTGWKALLSGGILMGAALLSWAVSGRAQMKGAPSSEISGTVTANRDYALSE